MKFFDALKWRFNAPKMPTDHISSAILNQILDAVRLAPTSAGLQPFHLLSIQNQVLKNKLAAAAAKPAELTECSHLLVFSAWTCISDQRIDQHYDAMHALRYISSDHIAPRVAGLKYLFSTMTQAQQAQYIQQHTHVALSLAIAAAAELGIHANPIHEFDTAQINQILCLKDKGLTAVVVLGLSKVIPQPPTQIISTGRPLHLMPVTHPLLKRQIASVSKYPARIVESSCVLVLSRWLNHGATQIAQGDDDANSLLDHLFSAQHTTPSFKDVTIMLPKQHTGQHTFSAAYIGMSKLIKAAATRGMHAMPIEAFDTHQLDQCLDLTQKGLSSVMLLALGRRDPTQDWLLKLEQYRPPHGHFVTQYP